MMKGDGDKRIYFELGSIFLCWFFFFVFVCSLHREIEWFFFVNFGLNG